MVTRPLCLGQGKATQGRPCHWPALVSAAAAVLAGVKGRFYYSHGRANALIQRRGTVPSGQREGGRKSALNLLEGIQG